MRINLEANEFVLKAADSKHYKETEKLDGKLILTNQRLYFTTVNGGADKMKISIETSDISEVLPFNNRVLFSNGMCLQMKDGNEMKFEVKERSKWMGLIAKVM
jgi:hypothetical protein